MKKILLLLPLLILLVTTCNSVEPPGGVEINLKLEDVSCTEAWITLSSNIKLPAAIELKQNEQVLRTINLNKLDSLLYIDSLLPNTSYQYQASSIEYQVTSNKLQLTTLDTTSHNFSWQTWTFGEHSSSVLYDVAIINENSIYAVGEIYMNDSLGQQDPIAYNAIYWDGTSWELIKIKTNACGGVFYPPIQAIFAFSAGDILFAHIDGSITHYNGIEFTNDCSLITQLNGSANKIWGISKNDYYVVSGNGFIAHYTGNTWTKIESGTDVDIQDIWGIDDGVNDPFILCAASNAIEPGEHKILKINNSNSVDTINWISNLRVHSVWMDSKYQLFSCGDGVYKNSSSNGWKKQDELTFVFTERIRGKSKNDLFVVGDFGLLAHYNGVTWQEYPEASTALVYTSLDFKNNLMVTVGYTQTKAVIQVFIKQ